MTCDALQLLPGPVAARLHVRSGGNADGPVLLFAHGLACDQEMWRDVVPYLADEHRVVLYDLMGAGRSDTTAYDPARYVGLDGHADDILQICHEQDLRDVTLVAHSISSMTAVMAAVREPDRFRRLVLLAPSPHLLDDPDTGYEGGLRRDDLADVLLSLDSNYFAWAESMAPVIMGTPDVPEHVDRLTRTMCRADPDITEQLVRAVYAADCRPLLPLVTTPSLLLQCRHDAVAPPSVGDYLAEHLAGSTLVRLQAVGHCPHVSAPLETADVIRRHLGGDAMVVPPPRQVTPDYRRLWDDAPSANVLLGDDGVVTAVNATFVAWTGRRRSDLVGVPFGDLLPAGDQVLFSARHLPRLMVTGRIDEASIQVLGPEGRLRAALMSAIRVVAPDAPPQVRLVLVEAEQRRRHELDLLLARRQAVESEARTARAKQELQSLVHHDGLTGLLNRSGLLSALHELLAQPPRPDGSRPTVVFVDLDGFKTVNDDLGHDSGDELLRVVAGRLVVASPPGALVARLAGDEFVVLDVLAPEQQEPVARDLLAALVQPVVLQGVEVLAEASVGVCQADAPAPAADVRPAAQQLIRRADMAMYWAKSAGGGRLAVHRPGTVDPTSDRLALLEQLRAAVRQQELRVAYQPRVDLATSDVTGVEALVRWQHPERGLLPPSTFIGPAESSGIIRELGAWVLGEAVAQAARWDDVAQAEAPRLQVTVNLSTRQLSDGDLVERVAQVLERTGLEPSRVVLEITETALMRRPEVALRAVRGLKALGVLVAVDDFGTGYSSLTYLKQFPVDELKIDRSFVAGMTEDRRDRAIVAACVDLAHALDLTAVAEGVETTEQLDALRELGCDQGQGFLLGRPCPADLRAPASALSS